jgi:hypothetical protein
MGGAATYMGAEQAHPPQFDRNMRKCRQPACAMKACDPIPTNATAATTRIVMRMMLRPFSKSKFVIQKP